MNTGAKIILMGVLVLAVGLGLFLFMRAKTEQLNEEQRRIQATRLAEEANEVKGLEPPTQDQQKDQASLPKVTADGPDL